MLPEELSPAVLRLCWVAQFRLPNRPQTGADSVERTLPTGSAIIIQTLFLPRLDYYSVILIGLFVKNTRKCHLVQIAEARLLIGTG